MKVYKTLVLTIVVFCLSTSCQDDAYELKEDENGRTIRLNKRTGEVAVLGSDSLQVLKTTDELEAMAEAEELARAALREAKIWPYPGGIPQLDVDEALLITSWRDEKLYYQLSLTPVPKNFDTAKKSNSLSHFKVNFQDSGNFNVLVLNIVLSQFSIIIDPDGTPMNINVNSSVTCSKEDYQMIQSWRALWNF